MTFSFISKTYFEFYLCESIFRLCDWYSKYYAGNEVCHIVHEVKIQVLISIWNSIPDALLHYLQFQKMPVNYQQHSYFLQVRSMFLLYSFSVILFAVCANAFHDRQVFWFATEFFKFRCFIHENFADIHFISAVNFLYLDIQGLSRSILNIYFNVRKRFRRF